VIQNNRVSLATVVPEPSRDARTTRSSSILGRRVFALSNEFDACSGNISLMRKTLRARSRREYSEFRRDGGCYKRRALLQSLSQE
jgi:hypothetical protein